MAEDANIRDWIELEVDGDWGMVANVSSPPTVSHASI